MIFVALAAVACGGREAGRTESGAVFDISAEILAARPDTTINLGKVHPGEVIKYDAWLRNTGGEPLVIVGVDTSCGCTSVEYERKPIAAGKSGRFSFSLDTRGMYRPQAKLIELRTSAGSNPYKIYVWSEVAPADI